jgi:serine/threonine-protein kinase
MAAIPNESKIPVGAVLVGKYKVTREIGRGGMAAVYEALHISLNKRIAIKVLAQELSASTVVIERFFREARAAASVKSPHIVDIYDSGRLDDGRPFIAMELLEGESLYDRMARIRIIDIPTTVRVIQHCAKGLVKAHAAGIVHRDLKPENIFLTKDENGDEIGKILDFGLAKFYAPVGADEKTARLTREGAVFGTPAYMSPEQVKGQGNVDHRADLWALGCMAYECLIGRPVWNTDQGVAMTFAAIAAAQIPLPSKQRPDLPASFDEWFLKCLARDVSLRYQTAKELADGLVKAFSSAAQISSVNFSGEVDISQLPAATARLSSDDEQAGAPKRRSGDRAMTPDPTSGRAPGPSGPALMTSPSGHLFPQPSNADVQPVSNPQAPAVAVGLPTGPPPKFRSNAVRYVVSLSALAVGLSAVFIAWSQYLRPQMYVPLVQSSASIAPRRGNASSRSETSSTRRRNFPRPSIRAPARSVRRSSTSCGSRSRATASSRRSRIRGSASRAASRARRSPTGRRAPSSRGRTSTSRRATPTSTRSSSTRQARRSRARATSHRKATR